MAGLLSDLDKSFLAGAFNSGMETFLRPLVIYQAPQKTIVSTNPDYNRFNAADQNNTSLPENDPIRYVVSGRVRYASNQTDSFLGFNNTEGQLKIKNPEGSVRIKVDYSGYMLLKEAKQIELDGESFDPNAILRPHGLFNPYYYDIILFRIQ
jgi:hypothetical protein